LLLGISSEKKPISKKNKIPVSTRTNETEKAVEVNREKKVELLPELREFLLGLVRPYDSCPLQDLSHDDRLFLSGIIKMLNENHFEIPVLPKTAIEITRLISNPLSSTDDFAKVLSRDPTLSLNVLRVANSAYYGCEIQAKSMHEAVFRIGITQIKTIVLLTDLQVRIMQGGVFQQLAQWLSEFSVALAHLAQLLAPELDLPPDAAFTCGMLYHLEFFVIMGILSEVCKKHRLRIHPSGKGLREAIYRFGLQVKERTAKEWGLEDLLIMNQEKGPCAERLHQLRCSLIAQWTGEDVPREVSGISPERLASALERIPVQTT
jgi:HD-like signal output (HDOD) protein